MAQTVNVNFRMDEADKKKMESVCSELGLSMSAAFTIFAKKMGREHRIPFNFTILIAKCGITPAYAGNTIINSII